MNLASLVKTSKEDNIMKTEEMKNPETRDELVQGNNLYRCRFKADNIAAHVHERGGTCC